MGFELEQTTPAEGSGTTQQGTQTPPAETPAAPPDITYDAIRAKFPEDIRGDKIFDQIHSIEDLAKSYYNGQKLVGKKREELINTEDPDQQAALHKALGWPETHAEYGLNAEAFKDIPGYEGEYVERLAEVAHQLKLTKPQMEGLVNFQLDQIDQFQTKVQLDRTKVVNELKDLWGGATDRHLAVAQRAVDVLGGDDAKTYFDQSGLGNNPILIRMFAKMGSMMQENGLIEADIQGMPSKENVLQEAMDIRSNKENPLHAAYWDPLHPRHEEAIQKVDRRYQAALNEPI